MNLIHSNSLSKTVSSLSSPPHASLHLLLLSPTADLLPRGCSEPQYWAVREGDLEQSWAQPTALWVGEEMAGILGPSASGILASYPLLTRQEHLSTMKEKQQRGRERLRGQGGYADREQTGHPLLMGSLAIDENGLRVGLVACPREASCGGARAFTATTPPEPERRS